LVQAEFAEGRWGSQETAWLFPTAIWVKYFEEPVTLGLRRATKHRAMGRMPHYDWLGRDLFP
jgi:hypothetical protein